MMLGFLLLVFPHMFNIKLIRNHGDAGETGYLSLQNFSLGYPFLRFAKKNG